MELTIHTKDSDAMEFLRKFIYEHKDEFEADEQYEHAEGYNKEPIVIAIILALKSGKAFESAARMFEAYMKYKTEKLKVNSKLLQLQLKTGTSSIELEEADACNPHKFKQITALEKKTSIR